MNNKKDIKIGLLIKSIVKPDNKEEIYLILKSDQRSKWMNKLFYQVYQLTNNNDHDYDMPLIFWLDKDYVDNPSKSIFIVD